MSSRDAGHAQDQYLWDWDTAQQGETFVPGKESKHSRAKRVKKAISAVDHHFSNPSATQQQGHEAQNAPQHGANADLNSVGQQFAYH
ncbi:hypothetical protein F5883DRAFT_643601 [Diaporthe sp. PMI_573]|nr:hypothetical protein F5883DRAFT_643601 [Diaporthaceae sp. PMI_573]